MGTIKENIAALCASYAPQDPCLIAVSKRQPQDKLIEALEAGQRIFGENRVQEAQQHWADFKESGDYPDLELHLIGPLQTNKVKQAVKLFDAIHTLDREKLADSLAEEMEKQNKDLPIFIQVNTGDEAQKSGVHINALEDLYDYAYGSCGLNIVGLMCIPPLDEPAGLHFGLLKKYADMLGLKQLSMGMSSDYKDALKFGATHIRLGTAIFGTREE